MNDFKNNNPLLFLLAIIFVVGIVFKKFLASAFGASSSRLRSLARARAAKRRKNKKRRR